jgi:hypothetical protein
VDANRISNCKKNASRKKKKRIPGRISVCLGRDPFCWFNFGNSAVIFSSMLPPTLFVYLYQFFLYAIAGILLWLLERRLVHGPFKKK